MTSCVSDDDLDGGAGFKKTVSVLPLRDTAASMVLCLLKYLMLIAALHNLKR